MTNAEWGTSPFPTELPIADEPRGTRPPRDLAAGRSWIRVEAALDRASEWLNPILVKEARQALKSRQFIVTFSLLLLFGWGWSLAGVALLSQAAYYAPGGRFMLTGYFLILAVPLLVIVPFSAFRSLAAEREDGTFELLSITTLQARQIISGKLGSAIVQMAVYYSALAPCVAFTYLLRGIDVLTIAMILLYTFLASVMLAQFSLLIATITRSSQWQVLLSLLLILFLVWCDAVCSYVIVSLIFSTGSVAFDNTYFWILQVAILMFYASFLVLLLFAAAAQISFASDNRSTKLRVIMLLQQLLWIGWMTYTAILSEEFELLYGFAPVAAIYWFFAGSLLCGESGQLSPRVKRALPQSLLGRALFTWFNPGSGTGYVFAVLNLWSLVAVVGILGFIAEITGKLGASRFSPLFTSATLCASYLTAYVGMARLLVLLVRRRMATGLILTLLVSFILAMLGIFVPLVLSGWVRGFAGIEYDVLQATNWAWSVVHSIDNRIWMTPESPLLVYSAAGAMLVANLFLAIREVEQVRAETPQRVLEDEWLLHPEKAPRAARSRTPWDGDEG